MSGHGISATALAAAPPEPGGDGWAPFTVRQPPRVTYADASLEHQIVITGQGAISVSCNCLRRKMWARDRRGKSELTVIESRTQWEPGEAMAAWRRWHGWEPQP